MKTTLAALLTLAAAVHAQDEDALRRPDNAALCYWRAIADLPRPTTEEEGAAQEAHEALADDVIAGEKPWEASLDAYLDAYAVEEVRRASTIARCDFGLHYEDGVEMMMPHLSGLRTVARMVLLASRRAQAQGEWEAATSRALECLQIARHVDQDELLISALVATAIAGQALDVLADLVDRAPAGSGVPARVETSLGALDPAGLVDWARAIGSETRVFRRAFAAAKLEDVIGWLGTAEEDPLEALAEQSGVPVETLEDPEYWKAELAHYERTMAAVVVQFSRPHAERAPALEALEKEGAAPGHALTRLVMPATARCGEKATDLEARVALVRVLAALRTREEPIGGLEGLPVDPATGKAFVVREVEGGVRIESAVPRAGGEEALGYVLRRR